MLSISVATVFSRATGYLRWSAQAAALGAGAVVAEAYSVAILLPGLIYELFVGGILYSIFIPVLVDRMTSHGEDDARRLTNALFTLVLPLMACSPSPASCSPAPCGPGRRLGQLGKPLRRAGQAGRRLRGVLLPDLRLADALLRCVHHRDRGAPGPPALLPAHLRARPEQPHSHRLLRRLLLPAETTSGSRSTCSPSG
jgi:hypothetical protein